MFEKGDYVKVEFKDEASGENEWMWVQVERTDDAERMLFGTLDNEPVVMTELRLGMELAVSYDNVREHMKPGSFNQ
jgi:uncharacterized protein YegJ (DUF2314 family)